MLRNIDKIRTANESRRTKAYPASSLLKSLYNPLNTRKHLVCIKNLGGCHPTLTGELSPWYRVVHHERDM